MNAYTSEELRLLGTLATSELKAGKALIIKRFFPEEDQDITDDDFIRCFPLLRGYGKGVVERVKRAMYDEDLAEMPMHLFDTEMYSLAVVAKWRLMIGK